MNHEQDDEPCLSAEAHAELMGAGGRPPSEDSVEVKLLKEMVEGGHSMEAAQYAKLLAYSGALNTQAAILVLADAILNPVKRKRGDKFNSRMTLEKLIKQNTIARAVESAIAEDKQRSRGGRKKHVAKALAKVSQDPKLATSKGSTKRAFYAHKPKIPTK